MSFDLAFQEFDWKEIWNIFLIPGELKKNGFRGSNNCLGSPFLINIKRLKSCSHRVNKLSCAASQTGV